MKKSNVTTTPFQTKLKVPTPETMKSEGFELLGTISKNVLNSIQSHDLPWLEWFFCPIQDDKVVAWFKS